MLLAEEEGSDAIVWVETWYSAIGTLRLALETN